MDSSLFPCRRIAHLDMDAFFASVELLHYPALRGLPVVVGGRGVPAPQIGEEGKLHCAHLRDYAGRGVVTTSTYEARALGVFSGMGLMKSAQLAPEAILLPANFEAYRHYSRLFKAAVATLAPCIEDRGIDEIYIDLSEHPEETRLLAEKIKAAVKVATGLSCSIGVTPNKLLSKIASDLDKPDGLTLLTLADLQTRIWPLPARKVNGIGPKASEKLKQLGIETIGQLAQTPPALLITHFGRHFGLWLHQSANGIDERPLETSAEPKSISRETTFERDLHAVQDKQALGEIFTALCERLEADLRRKGYASRTIGIKLRYADFQAVTRDLTLPQPVYEASAIRQAAGQCLKRIPLQQKIRLLGVRAGALIPLNELAAQAAEVARQPYQAELPLA